MGAGESLSLTVRDLLAQIAPHVDIDYIFQGDPGRLIATVIDASGSERSLCIVRATLHRYRKRGLTPDVRAELKEDRATRWIMDEAAHEAGP